MRDIDVLAQRQGRGYNRQHRRFERRISAWASNDGAYSVLGRREENLAYACASSPLPALWPVVRLVSLLDTPEHIPTLAPLIMREVCYLLLTGPEGNRLRATALATSQTRRIVDAVAWLVRNYDQPLKVEELAEEVHMSVSGFHHQFKVVTNLSPLQYQKQLRLQEARRLLLGHEANIAEASLRVGYVSSSQFSREYRQLFGASPKQDMVSSGIRTSLER